MSLSKQSILKHAGSFKTTEVHVPAWADENGDDVVLVRGMTLREFDINMARNGDDGLATASVVARCVVDESGGRVFQDADTNYIAELPIADLQAVTRAIMSASGMGASDNPDVPQAVADAEGNSEAIPSGD